MADGFSELTKQMLEDRKIQQEEFERQQKVLEDMKAQLEEAGLQAEDNKQYNKQKAKLDKQMLAFRLKGADSPSARKEIKQEQEGKDKKRGKLFTVMAEGITNMSKSMFEFGKGKVKGLLALLKGTLIAGLLIALIAFLDSQTWQDLKKQLVEVIIPKLVHFYKTTLKPFAANIVEFVKDPTWATLMEIFDGVENKKGLLGTLAGIAFILAPGAVLAPLKAGVSLAISGIAAAWGSGAISAAMAATVPALGMTVGKVLSIGSFIGALALAIYDGVTGFFKSDEWGVSKVSGFLGGFFAGTKEKGSWVGMGTQAAKYGALGAAAGSFIPLVGTAIGGAVGVIIGGILGYFGGERIAKAFDAMGKFIGDMWGKVTLAVKNAFRPIVEWFQEKFQWVKDKVVAFGQTKVGGEIVTAWTTVTDFIRDNVWNPIASWFTGLWKWASEGIAAGWTNVTDFVKGKWNALVCWFEEVLGWAESGILKGWTNISDFIKGKWDAVVCWFTEVLNFEDPANWANTFSIKGALETVICRIKEFFFHPDGKSGLLQFEMPEIDFPDIGRVIEALGAGAKAAVSNVGFWTDMGPREAFKAEFERVMGEKRQAGGPIIKGKPYLVGEMGPEIIVPSISGQVRNAQRTDIMQDAMLQKSTRGMGGMGGQAVIAPTTVANTNSTSITHTTKSIVNPDSVVSTVNKAA